MADVVARMVEGTALARRQNILRTLALFGGLRWGWNFQTWRSSEACGQDAASEDRKLSAEPLTRTRLDMHGYNDVRLYLGYTKDRIG